MSAPVPNYVHRARLARQDELARGAVPVHDADTFYLRLDLGTYAGVRVDPVVRVRLAGIDTVELGDRRADPADLSVTVGAGARNYSRRALEHGPVTVATERPIVTAAGETLGRTVARVWVGDDDLADLLRAAGYEKPAAA